MKSDRHHSRRLATPLREVEAFAFVSDRAFPRHAHDEYGLGVVIEGGHKSWSGRGEVEAVAGDVISVNPGEMHDGAPIDGHPRRWRMLYFDARWLRSICGEDVAGDIEFEAPKLRDDRARARILALFEAHDAFAFEAGVVEALMPLFARRRRRTCSIPSVTAGLERIDDDPASSHGLSELARESGLSRYQWLRAFAKATGATPGAYARQARARLARRLIRGGMDLAAAALESGYADQSHMTRALRAQFALTPGRLR